MRTAQAKKTELDYGYINARVRAMKSRLLSRSFIENLLSMSDAEEVLSALGTTEYRQDIEKATLRLPGICGIEEGLKDHLATSFNKIIKIVGGAKEASAMLAVLLGRWDLHNLRTIVRGKHAGVTEEELMSQLILAGSIDHVTLQELVKQPDVKSCIDLLVSWGIFYSKPLSEGYLGYLETGNLTDLELNLDKFYYEHALRAAQRGLFRGSLANARLVRDFLSREIDFINIMTALRIVKEDLADQLVQKEAEESADARFAAVSSGRERPAEEATESGVSRYFIKAGKELNIPRLVELAELPEVEDVVEALRDTSYGKLLAEGLTRFFETGSITVMERLMEERLIKQAVGLFKGDPLSVSLLIAYLWAKHNEVVNLRIIVQGKSVGMAEERVREALVLV